MVPIVGPSAYDPTFIIDIETSMFYARLHVIAYIPRYRIIEFFMSEPALFRKSWFVTARSGKSWRWGQMNVLYWKLKVFIIKQRLYLVFIHFFVIYWWRYITSNYINIPKIRHVKAQMENSCPHFLVWYKTHGTKTFIPSYNVVISGTLTPLGHSWSFLEQDSPPDHVVYGSPLRQA